MTDSAHRLRLLRAEPPRARHEIASERTSGTRRDDEVPADSSGTPRDDEVPAEQHLGEPRHSVSRATSPTLPVPTATKTPKWRLQVRVMGAVNLPRAKGVGLWGCFCAVSLGKQERKTSVCFGSGAGDAARGGDLGWADTRLKDLAIFDRSQLLKITLMSLELDGSALEIGRAKMAAMMLATGDGARAEGQRWLSLLGPSNRPLYGRDVARPASVQVAWILEQVDSTPAGSSFDASEVVAPNVTGERVLQKFRMMLAQWAAFRLQAVVRGHSARVQYAEQRENFNMAREDLLAEGSMLLRQHSAAEESLGAFARRQFSQAHGPEPDARWKGHFLRQASDVPRDLFISNQVIIVTDRHVFESLKTSSKALPHSSFSPAAEFVEGGQDLLAELTAASAPSARADSQVWCDGASRQGESSEGMSAPWHANALDGAAIDLTKVARDGETADRWSDAGLDRGERQDQGSMAPAGDSDEGPGAAADTMEDVESMPETSIITGPEPDPATVSCNEPNVLEETCDQHTRICSPSFRTFRERRDEPPLLESTHTSAQAALQQPAAAVNMQGRAQLAGGPAVDEKETSDVRIVQGARPLVFGSAFSGQERAELDAVSLWPALDEAVGPESLESVWDGSEGLPPVLEIGGVAQPLTSPCPSPRAAANGSRGGRKQGLTNMRGTFVLTPPMTGESRGGHVHSEDDRRRLLFDERRRRRPDALRDSADAFDVPLFDVPLSREAAETRRRKGRDVARQTDAAAVRHRGPPWEAGLRGSAPASTGLVERSQHAMSHERHREEKALTSGPRLPKHPLRWSHQRAPAETRGVKVASVLGDMTARLDALLQEADVLDSEYAAAAETLAAAEGEVAAQKVAAFEKVLDKFGELEHEAQLQESGLRAFGDCLLAVENVLHPQTGELAGERAGDDLRGDSDKTQKSEAHEASDLDPVCNTGSTAGITARWSRILVRPAKLGESVVISRGKCGQHSTQVVAVVKRPSKRWNTMTGTYRDVEVGAVCRR